MDEERVFKTAIQSGICAAVPAFGNPRSVGLDALATALIWAETSTWVTVADIVVSNSISAFRFPFVNKTAKGGASGVYNSVAMEGI